MASDNLTLSEVDALSKLCVNANLPTTRLYDSFDLEGPNGTHRVQALELLGANLAQFIFQLLRKLGCGEEYKDAGVLREISRRIVFAVC